MKIKPLLETNPYLKNPAIRKKLIARSVRTSCGVEGIKSEPSAVILATIPRRKDKKIYKTIRQ